MAINKIWAGPVDGANQYPLSVEGKADSAGILPGMLVKRTATGLDASDNAATVFGKELLIALEQGQHTGASITTAWDIDNNMVAGKPRSGELYNVSIAQSQVIVAGDGLSSNGNGHFKKAAVDGTEDVLLYANKDITTTTAEALAQAVYQ